ncbi:arginine--tRNA ligase [Haloferax mediterranei ATCC 33500]|uniref:Arginine--tRNA ligase n=1 Tax=Haloferax mediterranei (strain ATCC 33500 / DSM 1411 / JCM 8866 / NBRC 14739 / NCIMB 2177 / R-4) TaxID=523841 RepID=I3R1D8_HALMT|nr:arginine--tRNA ligase [Haloferax mediterranei]AFK18048.1 arginyl-tRNA synthetase [Haloferax mediterranei ATCC 33500]AHZ22538.1 arginyl-tRNA synthetase [Haloferax mediterranei ATCC 33500]EMA02675.1 arginyl-tRNA ligase [Haloferax mediterranei ATCC 33500]MDX5988141.1 arginine--tRNA ligase [Haloferax mediterranei ATCC 33500]QCQ74589.1 arginine--tRNA ligase [Haloferax mediterranei ATCC 33500]
MFRQFRKEVETALSAALSSLDLPTDDLGVEEPPEDVPATLASSVAFRLAGVVGAAPPKIAIDIAEEVSVEGYDYLGKVDTQGPYVNFHVTDAYYDDTLDAAADDTEYGRLPSTGDSVVVEHTSANPTGPVHVGRARNPIVGDAVANLLDFAGNDVERHYYVNDAGRQMAVFTWAYETFDEEDLDSEPERDRIEYDLVRYYRKGNAFLEEADPEEVEAAEAEITEILQGIEEGDEETYARVETVVDQVLGGMRECLERLPAEFDEFVKETRFMFDGSTRDLADRLKETEHAVYEEDAWQLELDEYDIEKNLVFLRSDGTSLYTTRDLAHHEWKFENYDRAVTVLGEDHKLQAGQLRAALDILGNDVDKLENVIFSWVNLPGGLGMSTRRGTGVMLDDLLDEAISRARDEVEKRLEGRTRDDDLDEEDIDRIARQVGIGAVRYDIVSKQPTKAITFEWDQALNFEAQSAPYIQYVHARCCGIVDEATAAGIDASEVDPSVLTTEAERDLLRTIARFPAVIEAAADDLEPHTIATFARELAEVFNTFYRECPVLDADEEVGAARLALVEASRNAVANALAIIGVEAPESM